MSVFQTYFIDALIDDKLTRWWQDKYLKKNKGHIRIQDEICGHDDWLSKNCKHGTSFADLIRMENAANAYSEEADLLDCQSLDGSMSSSEVTDGEQSSPTDAAAAPSDVCVSDSAASSCFVSQMSIETSSSARPLFVVPPPDYETSDPLRAKRYSTTVL
jgi:hypothetical protein